MVKLPPLGRGKFMRHQWLITVSTAVGLSFSAATPVLAKAPWQPEETRSAALKWEIGYLALSTIDAAQTIDCLHRQICEEGNPVFGSHPSTKKLILAKLGLNLVHFAAFSAINRQNPKAALRVAQISCVLQGSVVALNARFTF